MSGASERSNGPASGSILQSLFLVNLAHSVYENLIHTCSESVAFSSSYLFDTSVDGQPEKFEHFRGRDKRCADEQPHKYAHLRQTIVPVHGVGLNGREHSDWFPFEPQSGDD